MCWNHFISFAKKEKFYSVCLALCLLVCLLATSCKNYGFYKNFARDVSLDKEVLTEFGNPDLARCDPEFGSGLQIWTRFALVAVCILRPFLLYRR